MELFHQVDKVGIFYAPKRPIPGCSCVKFGLLLLLGIKDNTGGPVGEHYTAGQRSRCLKLSRFLRNQTNIFKAEVFPSAQTIMKELFRDALKQTESERRFHCSFEP